FFSRPWTPARVELNDSVCMGKPAVADTVVERIELDDVDARDNCVEHVLAARDHGEGFLDGSLRAAVPVAVTVSRRNDERLHGRSRHDCRRTGNHVCWKCE